MKRLKILIATLVTVGFAFLLPVMAERADRREPRQIVIVTRDMAFFLEGTSEANPAIRVKAGEEVLLTLRNEEPGMTHDFSIATWGATTRALKGGGTDRIRLMAPRSPGTTEYVCRPHAATMRGLVIVE
jgi:plastocyanin